MNLLYIDKQFKYVAYTSLSVQLVSGIVSVIAAMIGFGVYALVISQILSAFLLLLIYSVKHKFKLVNREKQTYRCVYCDAEYKK